MIDKSVGRAESDPAIPDAIPIDQTPALVGLAETSNAIVRPTPKRTRPAMPAVLPSGLAAPLTARAARFSWPTKLYGNGAAAASRSPSQAGRNSSSRSATGGPGAGGAAQSGAGIGFSS